MSQTSSAKPVLLVLIALCTAPLLPGMAGVTTWLAPVALLAGTSYALALGNPLHSITSKAAKWLLQGSVVLLGFSMDFGQVARAGKDGLAFSLISIVLVFGLGWMLQRWLRVRAVTGLLVSAGTAICGGSAIAAVSSVVGAEEEEISVAVGTVFLLNAVALVVFPPLGRLLGLSQHQFGVWSGIAVHDIASVVGAGSAYGPQALETGTAVKLARVLYLVPVTLIIAFVTARRSGRQGRKLQAPWFVGLFLLASGLRTVLPQVQHGAEEIKVVAACGFAVCLLLIGAGLTRETLKAVGVRPLVVGAVLWIAVSAGSLMVVMRQA